MIRRPVGAVEFGKSIVVVCDDGSAWFWGPVLDGLTTQQRLQVDLGNVQPPHTWIEFHTPIPGTRAAEVLEQFGAE